jgi:hypothetical protein
MTSITRSPAGIQLTRSRKPDRIITLVTEDLRNPLLRRAVELATWVGVDDTMPEDYHEVFTNLGYVCYRDNGHWRDAAIHGRVDIERYPIIHWRELPAIPEKGK